MHRLVMHGIIRTVLVFGSAIDRFIVLRLSRPPFIFDVVAIVDVGWG